MKLKTGYLNALAAEDVAFKIYNVFETVISYSLTKEPLILEALYFIDIKFITFYLQEKVNATQTEFQLVD